MAVKKLKNYNFRNMKFFLVSWSKFHWE